MSTTYLQAVNEILAESNEVQLTSGNFSSAVGIQDYVKKAVNKAYLEVCAEEIEWPFLAANNSNSYDPFSGNVVLDLVPGQRWYLAKTGSTSVAEDYSRIDWDSFTLTTKDVSGEVAPFVNKELNFVDYYKWGDTWEARELDDATGEQVYNLPERIIRSSDGRYIGVSPIPDKAYKIYFNAWVRPTKLSTHNTNLLVPDEYTPVMFLRAGYYLSNFKKDYETASMFNRDYRDSLRKMRRALMGTPESSMRDDRIRR